MTDPSPADYIPVSSDNFTTFIWTNQTTVVIHKCLFDILQNNLFFCQYTLAHIKFTSLTKVSNIKAILLNCPNLTHLTFHDALVDDYNNNYSQSTPNSQQNNTRAELSTETTNSEAISNNSVTHLTIICPLELSKNEYWLLSFFTNEVSLPKLVSLSFYSFTTIGGGGPRGHGHGHGQGQGPLLPLPVPVPLFGANAIPITLPQWTRESTEVMDQHGPEIDTNIILDFLLKYRKTLEKIWIGRPAFEINVGKNVNQNQHSDSDTRVELLKEINLTFLSVSIGSSGVNYLLSTQNNLETLNLVSNINLQTVFNIPEFMKYVFDCISRNQRSLKEVKLIPTIITGSTYSDRNRNRRSMLEMTEDIEMENLSKDNPRTVLDQFTVDCDLFSLCSKLEYLCLSLRAYRDEFEMWCDFTPILQGTKLKNMHQIPTENLVELCIPVEEYSRDELEKLAAKFKEFQKLKKFYFGTSQLNPMNSFLIRLSWIQDLTTLPKIEKVVFHNGVLQDVDGTRRIIQTRGPNGSYFGGAGAVGGAEVQNNGRNEIEVRAEVSNQPFEQVTPLITMIYSHPRYTFEISRRTSSGSRI